MAQQKAQGRLMRWCGIGLGRGVAFCHDDVGSGKVVVSVTDAGKVNRLLLGIK